MIGFTDYLTEATEQKNTHIDHLEDLALDGIEGVAFALTVLTEFGKLLGGQEHSHAMHVSTKWDGSPSLIFGPDPSGKGFFVATKSVFAKTPKLAHNHAEIDALYPAGVAKILHVAYDHLQALQPAYVLQGDVMFIRDSVEDREHPEDVPCYTFQPNTIVYAVPQNSALGAKVQAAAIGLALHTIYIGTGDTLQAYSAQPVTRETFAMLRPLPDVFVINAQNDTVSDVRFSEDEESDFTVALDRAASVSVDAVTYATIASDSVRRPLSRFLNYVIREDMVLNAVEYVEAFFDFLADRRSRQTVRLTSLRQGLEQWFRLYIAIARAKTVVLRALERAQSEFGTFVRTDSPKNGGLKSTGPEGFVINVGHQMVKLVDRNEFSKLNFAR